MIFRQFIHEDTFCLSYVIGCTEAQGAAVIDPQGDLAGYLAYSEREGVRIAAIIETHVQADHRSGSRDLARKTGAPIYLGPRAEVSFAHKEFSDGDLFTLGNRRFKILHTPGHTPEHICLWVNDWFLLTGDTLFVGDAGRVDLPSIGAQDRSLGIERHARDLWKSLQRLSQLPQWTEIYPGHYAGSACGQGMDGKPVSTIGREIRKNPALKLSEDEFVELQKHNAPAVPEAFIANIEYNRGVVAG